MAAAAPAAVDAHPYRDFERAGWQRAALAYAGTFEKATSLYVQPLLAAVGQPKSLLDVACGTGGLTAAAAALGVAAVGVDFSPAMLVEAKRCHPGLAFHEADAEALPFTDASFDAVLINFGVHHFPFPVRALSEARRVMRSGARLAFTVWATPDEHALHRIALEASNAAGASNAALPTPPGGAINHASSCLALLQEAGFDTASIQAHKLPAALWLNSDDELIHLLFDGTVRLSSMIRSQPPEVAARIVAAIRLGADAYRKHCRFFIPLMAVLAVAVRA